jgi:tetratricopeptide (TPR) repeat protein
MEKAGKKKVRMQVVNQQESHSAQDDSAFESAGQSTGIPNQENYLIKNRVLRMLLPSSILMFLTGLIYYPSLHYPFQFDDIANISKRFGIRFDNPLARWWDSSRWFGDWLNTINFRIGRFDPFTYRLLNVCIHFLSGLLVFALIYRLCRLAEKRPFFYDNALFLGFVSGGLFLLHPVQTQTVSYVIQARLEGLATLFVLATLLIYVLATTARNFVSRALYIMLMLVFGILSCGTKELVVSLPPLLILIDWFFISQQEWASFKKRLLIMGIFCAIFIAVVINHVGLQFILDSLQLKMTTGNNRGNILTPDAFDVITPWQFLISEFKVVLHYLSIFVWPFNMSVEYDWKMATSFFSFDVILPFILLMSLFGFIAQAIWRKKYTVLAFGLTWFFIAISPRSTILPSPELVCDYKTYLSSVGIMFILATMFVYFFNFIWSQVRNVSQKFYATESRIGAFACLLLLIGFGAYQRNLVWATCVDFWMDNAQKAPNKARVHNNLGVALSEAGRIDESIVAYQRAISLDTHYADPLSNLAVAYSLKGDVDKAIDSLKGAIHICPNYPEAYNNLGTLLLQKKMYEDAEKALQIAIQLRPYYGKAFYNCARLYEEKGDHNKSWEFLKKATEGDLDTPEVFFKLGQMSMKIQKYQEAVVAFHRIIERGVSQDQVWFNLANAYFMLGQHDRAKMVYEKLVRDNPLDARYLYNLAEAYFTKNDFEHAYELFKKSTTLPQPVPQAFFRAAHCLERLNRMDDACAYLQDMLTLNAADDFKKMVRTELARMTLQHKVAEGNGSIKLQDLKNALALSQDPNKKEAVNVASNKKQNKKSKTV